MVNDKEICIKSNVIITEIYKNSQNIVVQTHNSISKNALYYTVTRIINKYITTNTTNHVLNLLALGYGASDICNVPSPATINDTDLVTKYNLSSSAGYIIKNNTYIDITNYITFTSENSWKINVVINNNIITLPSGMSQAFINEIGAYVSNKDNFSTPVLFARVTTSPLILKPERTYIIEWAFSLTYEV